MKRRPFLALVGALALLATAACSSSNNNKTTTATSAVPSGGTASTVSTRGTVVPAEGATIDGIPCESSEQLTYHVHAHLWLFNNAQAVNPPANIGISQIKQCIYWLHTHDMTGIIHIEALMPRSFTLGMFFDVWHQPLDATHCAGLTSAGSNTLVFYVDGQQYTGNPRDIPLAAHTQVVVELGGTFISPPPVYTFPPGL